MFRSLVWLGLVAGLSLGATGCQTAAERKLREEVDHLNAVNMQHVKETRELMDQIEQKETRVALLQEDLRGKEKMIETLKSRLENRPTGFVDPLGRKQRINLQRIAQRVGGDLVNNRIRLPGDFLFSSGSWSLKGSAKRALGEIAGELNTGGDGLVLMLVGHTDNEPIKKLKRKGIETNRELSLKRSLAVLEYLRDQATYPPELMYPTGWGALKPIASNDSAQGRARNRRVEIYIDPVASNINPISAISGVGPASGAPTVSPTAGGATMRIKPTPPQERAGAPYQK
jgi:flagellar motor protein MotB